MSPLEEEETLSSSSSYCDFTQKDAVEIILLDDSSRFSAYFAEDHCMRSEDLAELRLLEGNERCIHCNVSDPQWACVALGIFMCLECSSHHRALGTHVSRVRSVQMDSWIEGQIQLMKCGGNQQCLNFFKEHGEKRGLVVDLDLPAASTALLASQLQAGDVNPPDFPPPQPLNCLTIGTTIADRYDSATALWYQEILKARRDGKQEPTERPNYTPARRKEVNRSHEYKQQQQLPKGQHPRHAIENQPGQQKSPRSAILNTLNRWFLRKELDQ